MALVKSCSSVFIKPVRSTVVSAPVPLARVIVLPARLICWSSVLILLKGTSKLVPASVIRRFEPTTLNELINSFVSLASPGIALPPTCCHVVPSQAYN